MNNIKKEKKAKPTRLNIVANILWAVIPVAVITALFKTIDVTGALIPIVVMVVSYKVAESKRGNKSKQDTKREIWWLIAAVIAVIFILPMLMLSLFA